MCTLFYRSEDDSMALMQIFKFAFLQQAISMCIKNPLFSFYSSLSIECVQG